MQIISGIQRKPLKVVLYGAEGIGKSTFAAQAPNPLFLDTEGSTVRMDVRRFEQPSSYTMLCQQIDYVIQNPGICSTLVLDTADWAERMVIKHVCDKNNWTSVESPGYGAGYRYVYEEFGRLLARLDKVADRGIHIIINAHAAMRKFEQPDQMGSYDRWELKLQNSSKCNVAAMVKEWADMVLFANYETFTVQNKDKKEKAQGGKRVMYTTHHPCWDAKNRFGLPEKMPFGFAGVAQCFGAENNQNIPAQPKVDSVLPQNPGQQAVNPMELGSGKSAQITSQTSCHSEQPEKTAVEEAVQQVAQMKQALSEGIPQRLRQLMEANNVTEAQIRHVVAFRGYYPEATPIAKYDPAFVDGVLVGAWEQVHNMILGGK